MKRFLLALALPVALFSCRSKNTPEVSGIQVDLHVQRFEQDFFAMDTTHLMSSLQQLQAKYPLFLPDFIANIMGLPPVTDTSLQAQQAIRQFIAGYRPVKDSADKIVGNPAPYEKEIRRGLQFVKYYFPTYKTPSLFITFIGPMDAFYQASLGGYGDVLTHNAVAAGLQLHLGSKFPMYLSAMGQSMYPAYVSRRFAPEFIPVNAIKNIVDDLYPERIAGLPMVEQMVEKGKRLYVLDKLMPYTADTLKTGYTNAQLEGCFKNEGAIWNFFLANNLLYNKEPDLTKGFLGDGPNTPELGEASPGYIGLFIGWQIVKKYMSEHADMKPDELLRVSPGKIFEESRYRPR